MRRVRRPKDKSDFLDKITTGETAVFDTYKDALIFAASLGAYKGERKSFDKSDEQIPYQYFKTKADNEVLLLMTGIFGSGDFDILNPDNSDLLLTIFEEYANAGLEIMKTRIENSGADQMHTLINLVQEVQKESETSDERDFSEIMDALGS